VFYLLMAHG